MTWAKFHRVPLRRLVPTCVLMVACGSCAEMLSPFLARAPSTTGTWTGRLVSATTEGYGDAKYPAVALDVETGPRTLGSGRDVVLGPDRNIVLLCRGQGIIDPEELGMPLGSRVKVRGTMRGSSPIKMIEPIGKTGGVMAGARMASPRGNRSVVIDIGRGKPKVVRE